MSKQIFFRRIVSLLILCAFALSFFPMTTYAQETTSKMSFSIDGTSYYVDMKLEGDLLYCRADQWAEAAGCLFTFNPDVDRALFHNNDPVIFANYGQQDYIKSGDTLWVPFFDAARQTGVYFSKVSDNKIYGYRVTPLTVFYKDMDRMFAVSKYRISELIIQSDALWMGIDTLSRFYAALSAGLISGFLDSVSGKMEQDLYDDVFISLLRTDENLLNTFLEDEEDITNPFKLNNLLLDSLEDGSFTELLKQWDVSQEDIQMIVDDLSDDATLNGLSGAYEIGEKLHIMDILKLMDKMTVSIEADAQTVMAMQAVFGSSESKHIRQAVQKSIGARAGGASGKVLSSGMYTLEFMEEAFLDIAIEKLEDNFNETIGFSNLDKLAIAAAIWGADKIFSISDTSEAIMYSDVYSQIQLELVNYYYKHRNDASSDNGLLMHSVAMLYLRSCLASWQLFEYDSSLSQAIGNAKSTLTAEITNLMKYTEEELLQNGTSEETVAAIITLVKAAPKIQSSLLDYLGKDISNVVNAFGTDYIDEYMDGGHCYTYDDFGGVFFFEDMYGNGTTVHTIVGFGDADFGYGFSGQMTYSEVLETVARYTEAEIGEPEEWYNMMDDRTEYSLSFKIQDILFVFSWTEEPSTNKSYSLTVIRQNSHVNPSELNSLYLKFLQDYPNYLYYALLDINQDGMVELLATESDCTWGSAFAEVDFFVYRDGEIRLAYENIWSNNINLMYSQNNQWIEACVYGTGRGNVEFYYLDEKLNVNRQSFDRSLSLDEKGNEIIDCYLNGKKVVTEEDQKKFDQLVEQYYEGGSAEIIFQPVPGKGTPGFKNNQLSRIKIIHEDGSEYEHLFYYNESGKLNRIEQNGYTWGHYDYFLSYDNENRLIKMESGDIEQDFYEYRGREFSYDNIGRLSSAQIFGTGFGWQPVDYSYDDDRRYVQRGYSLEGEYDYSIYEFSYDAMGNWSEVWSIYPEYDYRSVWNYQYDQWNRVTKEVHTTQYSDGTEYVDELLYSYDYAPLVFCSYESGIRVYYDFGLLYGEKENPWISENANIFEPADFYFDELPEITMDNSGRIKRLSGKESGASGISVIEFYYSDLDADASKESLNIELNWNGCYGSGDLMEMTMSFQGTYDDGLQLYISEDSATLCAADGTEIKFSAGEQIYYNQELIAVLDNSNAKNGIICLELYKIDGSFSFVAETDMDRYIREYGSPANMAVRETGVVAYVRLPGSDNVITYTTDQGLRRSYTGVWVFSPFSIDHGAIVEN